MNALNRIEHYIRLRVFYGHQFKPEVLKNVSIRTVLKDPYSEQKDCFALCSTDFLFK